MSYGVQIFWEIMVLDLFTSNKCSFSYHSNIHDIHHAYHDIAGVTGFHAERINLAENQHYVITLKIQTESLSKQSIPRSNCSFLKI